MEEATEVVGSNGYVVYEGNNWDFGTDNSGRAVFAQMNAGSSDGVLAVDQDGEQTCNPTAHVAPVLYEDDPPCMLGQDLPVDCRLCWALFPDEGTAEAVCDP